MTFFIIGILLLIFGIYFFHWSMKNQDKEGVIGFAAIIVAALFLLVFYGLFFQALF